MGCDSFGFLLFLAGVELCAGAILGYLLATHQSRTAPAPPQKEKPYDQP
jgi:hypothetical protein